jgi:hypothetical protein
MGRMGGWQDEPLNSPIKPPSLDATDNVRNPTHRELIGNSPHSSDQQWSVINNPRKTTIVPYRFK